MNHGVYGFKIDFMVSRWSVWFKDGVYGLRMKFMVLRWSYGFKKRSL